MKEFTNDFKLVDFKTYLLNKDLSESTISLYADNITQFKNYFEDTDSIDFDYSKVTIIDLRDYRSFLLNVKKLNANTVNTKIMCLKSYFNFLYESKLIKVNPSKDFKKIKIATSYEVKSFDDKTYRKLRREIYRAAKPLHIAMFETFTKTGCRVSELCNLKLSSITITDRTANVEIIGKGCKIRTLKLHLDAKKAILDYLELRNKIPTNNDYLFISERNCKFTRSGVWKILKKYAERVGEEDITLHSFRHYVLRRLLKEGVDLNTVSAIAGHAAPLVTAKIYTTASKEDQDKALDLL